MIRIAAATSKGPYYWGSWKKYLTRRPSRLQRNSPQIPTTNKQTNNLKPRQALLLGGLKVLSTKDRRESRRRKTEQPHPNTSLKEEQKELKETRDREKRCVCLKEPQRELVINGEANVEKPQVARKRRRCCCRGEERRSFSSIHGNRSFQATKKKRERDIYRSRAA
jgi:hypothetical protein